MADSTAERDSTSENKMAAEQHSLINSTFPVLLPEMPELRYNRAEFEAHIKSLLPKKEAVTSIPIRTKDESTVVPKSGEASKSEDSKEQTVDSKDGKSTPSTEDGKEPAAPFMTALLSDKATVPSLDDRDGKMLTENADVAYRTSGEALVDLFFELEDVISASRMKDILEKAWENDTDATLKIIWNARSIHLGKSSRPTFYRAVGWLAENHPMTLVENLPWLVRPLIQKKAPKKDEKKEDEPTDAEMIDAKDADSDFELVDPEDRKEGLEGQPAPKKLKLDGDDAQLAEFDVKYGVSHGYWKDLLNILALAANDQLKVDGTPRSVLNVEKPPAKKYKRDWTAGQKKATNAARHDCAVKKLEEDDIYKALHLSVARLFADQLKTDLARLSSNSKADMKRITLAAKWAPTHKGMHDQHTCIVSSVAEMLYPFDTCCPEGVDPADRELYLRYARIAYQSQTLSPLRKHLSVVEREITAEKFTDIKYERVPSLAMKQYTPLFAKKDFEHFDQYIERVAAGKSRISGATLLPSTLVAAVTGPTSSSKSDRGADAVVQKKLRDIQLKSIDGQWNTLVQRIKDSGTLESSIAVCDVSGSMSYPNFPDGTVPMDSSIGLSLLLAEVTKPPFGGAFITFHTSPQILRAGGADDKRSFEEKVNYMKQADWGGSTDIVAVLEKLILPMAVENKLSREDMVKQVFIFSDMQFNSADDSSEQWTTAYERIRQRFKEAGYEVPRLVFWNLAGGRAGWDSDDGGGDDATPKPVTAAEEGTALVNGYSQGQMKMFMDNGSFEDEEEEEVIKEKEGDNGEVVVEKKTEKKKKDPLDVVRKAISHDAYPRYTSVTLDACEERQLQLTSQRGALALKAENHGQRGFGRCTTVASVLFVGRCSAKTVSQDSYGKIKEILPGQAVNIEKGKGPTFHQVTLEEAHAPDIF
ncbi:hypothetical protein LTR37_011614, partial [Vermiconidia calcicola]